MHKGEGGGEVREDRCLRKGRDAGVDGGGGGGGGVTERVGGCVTGDGDGNPAELPECGRLQRR